MNSRSEYTPYIRSTIEGASISREGYKEAATQSCGTNTCSVVSTSLYASDRPSPKTNSDDLAITGASQNGLPFIIAVDGFHGCDQRSVFDFIRDQIMPLLDKYTVQLQADPTHYTEINHQFIAEIASIKQKFKDKGVDFTMSIAVTFEHNDKTYVAGFGVGDVGVVSMKRDGTLVQLAEHTMVRGFKDGFDDYTIRNEQRTQDMIQRSSCFLQEVSPGDQIVAYTSLPNSMEQTISASSDGVQRLALTTTLPLDRANNTRLIDQLLNLAKTAHERNIAAEQAKPDNANWRIGDDCTLASITMPTPQLRMQLMMDNLRTDLLRQLPDHSDKSKKSFSTFFSKNSDSESAARKLIKFTEGYSVKEFSKKEIKALLSDERFAPIVNAYIKYGAMPNAFLQHEASARPAPGK